MCLRNKKVSFLVRTLNKRPGNEFVFWSVNGIMNTSGLLQSFRLTLQETEVFMIPLTDQKSNLLLIFTFYIIGQVSVFT